MYLCSDGNPWKNVLTRFFSLLLSQDTGWRRSNWKCSKNRPWRNSWHKTRLWGSSTRRFWPSSTAPGGWPSPCCEWMTHRFHPFFSLTFHSILSVYLSKHHAYLPLEHWDEMRWDKWSNEELLNDVAQTASETTFMDDLERNSWRNPSVD